MRLHSDTLTDSTIREALKRAKESGRVDSLVLFSELRECRSRSRKHGYEIKLEWIGTKEKGDGRRYTNGGNYGANHSAYGAFRDEWGWFISELYSVDPEMVFGHYKSRDEFDTITRFAYGD